MHVAVAGGNLQGVEAAYLARKAGWEVTVLDRRPEPPARGMCDRFVQTELSESEDPGRVLAGIDAVLPAIENPAALAALELWTRRYDVPFAFDPSAYAVSASKGRSNRLFARLGLPTPRPWPACGLPVVVKPDGDSGSRGVACFHDAKQLAAHLQAATAPQVVQEWVAGPCFSIEVVGRPGSYRPLRVTDLDLDPGYDCKRVTAPTRLAPAHVRAFEAMAEETASALNLKGLMDLECVLHNGTLKLIEIDARLPSQTPSAVFWAYGINMVQVLVDLFRDDRPPAISPDETARGVVYEHVRATPGQLETGGEHMMGGKGALCRVPDFFGADEAITNYDSRRSEWVATLIVSGRDLPSARDKRDRVIGEIRRHCGLERFRDPFPDAAMAWGTV